MPEHDSHLLGEMVAEAMARHPSERAAYVLGASGGDDALRSEAMSLLSAVEKSGGFMERPTQLEHSADTSRTRDAAWIAAEASRVASRSAFRELAGGMIGRYKLLEQIGEGGFGAVFMAEQAEPVRRRVALKIVKLGMDTRAVVARFEQERQALALMDHPNIAKVFDAGATDAGRPYFVMELVKGDPITTYCDAASQTIRERLELFVEVCRAVQHAHTKGIIHRDIKPGNVLVSTQDGRPWCKIIDFGIAKATQQSLTEKTIFTEFRQFIGTPEYMSPEQAAGGLDIDTRTDVYSLGVLLYELLAGVTPFDPQQLRSAEFGEIQRLIREVDPPAPSTRISKAGAMLPGIAAKRRSEPHRLRPLIRGELDCIAMRALDKDRARRYETAEGLAEDVRRFLDGRTVAAAPPSTAYRLRKFVRRNRVLVGGAGALMIAILAGGSATAVLAIRASRARDRAEKAEEAVRQRLGDLERVAAFQESQLRGIDPELMGKRLHEAILSGARAGMERANLTPERIAERQKDLADLLGDANATSLALGVLDANVFDRALKAAREQFNDQPLVKARLLQTLASTLQDLGLLERASQPQIEAIALRRKTLGDDAPATIESIVAGGNLLLARGNYAGAEAALRDALERATRTLGENHRQTLGALNDLAMSLLYQGKQREAEPYLRDLIDRFRRAFGEEDSNTLQVINNMGGLLMDQGRAAEAQPYFRESLDAWHKNGRDDDPDAILALSNLALCIERQHRPTDAEPLYREALERSRRIHGEDHPDTLLYESNLGFLLCSMGKLDDAEPLTIEALEARRRTLGNANPDTLQSVHNLGTLRLAQGKDAEAATLLQEALWGRERVFGIESHQAGETRSKLARALESSGKFADAERLLLGAESRLASAPGRAHDLAIKDLAGLYLAWDKAEPGKGHGEAAATWNSTLERGASAHARQTSAPESAEHKP